jgi:hypothetical protein
VHRRARAIVAAGLALICAVARCATAGEWDGVAFEQASPAKMRCWLVLPTRLVPDDADIPFAEKPQLYSLRAGRNEYESVQLVILSADRFEGLSPKFTEFKSNGGGKAFSPSHWQANKLGQVPGKVAGRAPPPIKSWPARPADAQPQQISPAMISSSAAAAIPDPLLPEKSFDVDVGLTRIWLTVQRCSKSRWACACGTTRCRRHRA